MAKSCNGEWTRFRNVLTVISLGAGDVGAARIFASFGRKSE